MVAYIYAQADCYSFLRVAFFPCSPLCKSDGSDSPSTASECIHQQLPVITSLNRTLNPDLLPHWKSFWMSTWGKCLRWEIEIPPQSLLVADGSGPWPDPLGNSSRNPSLAPQSSQHQLRGQISIIEGQGEIMVRVNALSASSSRFYQLPLMNYE